MLQVGYKVYRVRYTGEHSKHKKQIKLPEIISSSSTVAARRWYSKPAIVHSYMVTSDTQKEET